MEISLSLFSIKINLPVCTTGGVLGDADGEMDADGETEGLADGDSEAEGDTDGEIDADKD